ncbi:MAG: DUF924 domain-containing protein [Cyanobacteria bacterium RM1_2_2]|nr:DUF924 domain-containing protein [Cyanobacteria bacterium RM1_2_2]
MHQRLQAILDFWFGDPQTEETTYQARRKFWFGKQPEFDAAIGQKFREDYEQAANGKLDAWRQEPLGCLGLIIVLDQFSRNMFRDTPQAFATDAKALSVAQQAVAQGFDQALQPLQRMFVYLPFEHSENRAHQAQSVALFRQLHTDATELEDVFDYAVRHQVVIEQFGRFPHRNQILGRESTPEEIEFLKQPGSSF